MRWPDIRYRDLLLRAPRSTWSVEAIRIAASLVPGVRRVVVRDGGGLDIDLPVFGTFDFIERVFGAERDIVSPNFFTVLVALTDAAIFEGPAGVRVSVESVIEDLRPIGIYPRVQEANRVFVGIAAELVVTGIPLPRTSTGVINDSDAAKNFKKALLDQGPAVRRPARFRRTGALLGGDLRAHGRTRSRRCTQPEAAPFAAAPGPGETTRRACLQRATLR